MKTTTRQYLRIFTCLLAALWLCSAPVSVLASTDDSVASIPLAPLLVSEIQVGSVSTTNGASEEFIELYNAADQPIDLGAHHWQLVVASSAASSWQSPLRTIPLLGVVAPGASYVVASQYTVAGQTVSYQPAPDVSVDARYSAALAASAGHLRLVYTTYQDVNDTCVPVVTAVDQVEWSAPSSASNGVPASDSLDARSVLVTPTTAGVPKGSSLQRVVTAPDQTYQDSNNDVADFQMSSAVTPGGHNTLLATAAQQSQAAAAVIVPPVSPPEDQCDPSAPTSDTSDESNGLQPPAAQDAPPSTVIQQDVDAPPTNSSTVSGSQPVIPASDIGLVSPQITELLPNPVAPQTDATDEFIELYNSNDAVFDLSGFRLEVGLTTKRHYTFANGTYLQPKSFTSFFSSETGLALSNTGGQVHLLDPLGNPIGQSEQYGNAKDGQAWTLANGSWYWSVTPTPNSANVVTLPAAVAKKKTAGATVASAKKSSSDKVAAAAKPKTPKSPKKEPDKPAVAVTTKQPSTPLHPGVLAVVGVSALLYGAYEYRQDMANKFYQFRANRTARRAARAEPEGG